MRAISLVIGTAAALCACGDGGGASSSATGSGKRPFTYDSPLVAPLSELRRTGPRGATRRLDALTRFDWDAVYLFGEGTPYRTIDATVGVELFDRDGRFLDNGGTLLVFTRAGDVVHAAAFGPPLFLSGDRLKYGPGALLRAHTKDPGPYALNLEANGE